tara:strand:- start:1 stop:144 length:144 start_codon:yes stop_codon:yes gene_type:complete
MGPSTKNMVNKKQLVLKLTGNTKLIIIERSNYLRSKEVLSLVINIFK